MKCPRGVKKYKKGPLKGRCHCKHGAVKGGHRCRKHAAGKK
jgi:hypothetical protein